MAFFFIHEGTQSFLVCWVILPPTGEINTGNKENKMSASIGEPFQLSSRLFFATVLRILHVFSSALLFSVCFFYNQQLLVDSFWVLKSWKSLLSVKSTGRFMLDCKNPGSPSNQPTNAGFPHSYWCCVYDIPTSFLIMCSSVTGLLYMLGQYSVFAVESYSGSEPWQCSACPCLLGQVDVFFYHYLSFPLPSCHLSNVMCKV